MLPIRKVDRYLANAVGEAMRHKCQLDHEDVAIGFDLIQIHADEAIPLIDAESAGGVADGEAQDSGCIDAIRPPTEQLAQRTPACVDAAAGGIA